ncbi:MAG: TIGR02206 family membrane protein [Parvibaculales bacterium]
MNASPFVLYGFQHVVALIVIFGLVVFGPLYIGKRAEQTRHDFALGLGAILIYHEIQQVFNAFIIGLPWQEALPFHMCDMSALSAAVYLIWRKRLFFLLAYFWGLGGGIMALLQPDIPLGFPDPAFMPYFFGHGLIVGGVLYACIALRERPYLGDVWRVVKVSLGMTGVVYVLNYIFGHDANFWYLKRHPASDSIMNFFPDPPLHILVLVPLAIFVFYVSYLPYFFKDRLEGRN